MNKKVVTYYNIARMVSILPFFLLICAIVALIVDRSVILLLSFMFPAIWSIFMWVPVMNMKGVDNVDISLRHGFVIASSTWLILSFMGSMPFFLSGSLDFISAWFESMSGFTATGLTMFYDVENLPKSLILWRSMMQWIGGLGVVVIFLSFMLRRSKIFQTIYMAEGHVDKIFPSIVGTSRRIWFIYSLYTIAAFVVLAVLGVGLFESLNLAMTSIATGGFSVKNDSLASYPPIVVMALIPFMLLGAISFASHMALFRGKIKNFFTVETVAMFIVLGVSSLILIPFLIIKSNPPRNTELHGFFQIVSAVSGTGFSTTDLSNWSDYSKVILALLMIFGGCYGSTASGIKLIRIVVLFYGIIWHFKKRAYPESAVIPFKIGKKVYDDSEIRDIAIFTTAYITLLLFGALVFMACGYSAADAIFEVASAEGNVGLSVGITRIDMHPLLKVLLIFIMWLGRLEIFCVLVFIFYPLTKYSRIGRR